MFRHSRQIKLLLSDIKVPLHRKQCRQRLPGPSIYLSLLVFLLFLTDLVNSYSVDYSAEKLNHSLGSNSSNSVNLESAPASSETTSEVKFPKFPLSIPNDITSNSQSSLSNSLSDLQISQTATSRSRDATHASTKKLANAVKPDLSEETAILRDKNPAESSGESLDHDVEDLGKAVAKEIPSSDKFPTNLIDSRSTNLQTFSEFKPPELPPTSQLMGINDSQKPLQIRLKERRASQTPGPKLRGHTDTPKLPANAVSESEEAAIAPIDDQLEEFYEDMDDDDVEEAREAALKGNRSKLREAEGDLISPGLPDVFLAHPIKAGHSVWFWKYQVILIIGALVTMYCFQLVIDLLGRKRLSLHSRPSTCLLLGANFRGLGETKIVSAARCLTCAFLHAHIHHLCTNVLALLAAWSYLLFGPGMKPEHIWAFHWTFPLFIITAFVGSFYSYHTTLLYHGLSIGASGGGLGLSTAFVTLAVTMEGVPAWRRSTFIMTILTAFVSCVPLNALFGLESSGVDLGAHIAGAISGMLIGFLLSRFPATNNGIKLIEAGDLVSLICIGLLMLAYLEIAREYIVDGRELIVRAYVKWLGLSSQSEEAEQGRRTTTPGRLQCEVLTEEYLYLLDTEQIEDDPDTILRRLEKENKMRRKTFPELGGLTY